MCRHAILAASLKDPERCLARQPNLIPARRSHYDEKNKIDFMQKNLP